MRLLCPILLMMLCLSFGSGALISSKSVCIAVMGWRAIMNWRVIMKRRVKKGKESEEESEENMDMTEDQTDPEVPYITHTVVVKCIGSVRDTMSKHTTNNMRQDFKWPNSACEVTS